MTPSRAKRKFPQLDNVRDTSLLTHSLTYSLTHLLTHSYLLTHLLTHSLTYLLTHSLTHSYGAAQDTIKYCSIFYEGMHDDARTNLAIALTAADEGAVMSNYMEVVDFIPEKTGSSKLVGAVLQDVRTAIKYTVFAKSILFCGGPYTDHIRKLESQTTDMKSIIRGTSGIHVVLPSYYSPSNFGLVDMSTSDGRFLFYLPWYTAYYCVLTCLLTCCYSLTGLATYSSAQRTRSAVPTTLLHRKNRR